MYKFLISDLDVKGQGVVRNLDVDPNRVKKNESARAKLQAHPLQRHHPVVAIRKKPTARKMRNEYEESFCTLKIKNEDISLSVYILQIEFSKQ